MYPLGGESMFLAPCTSRLFLFKLGDMLVIVALQATLNSRELRDTFIRQLFPLMLSVQFMNKVAICVIVMIECLKCASKK